MTSTGIRTSTSGTRSSCRAGSGCRRTGRSSLRGPSARLLGLDPRTALVVDDLPPPLARMLDELAAPTERVGLVARAVQRGADRDAAEELLRRLVDAGVLVDADGPDRVARQRAAAGGHRGGRRPARGRVPRPGSALAGVGSVWVEADAGRRGAGGRSRDGSARRRPRTVRPSRRSWTSSGGSRPGTSVGPATGPRRAGPVRARRRRRPRSHAARGPAPRPRRAPARPAARRHRESSGRWCCRAGRRASGAWSCTGAPATPAGRPSRPSSSGDPAAADAAAAAATAALGVAQVLAALDVAGGGGAADCHRCSAPPWSSTSPRASCCAARGRRTRTARVAHHRPRRHAGRPTDGGQS